MYTYIYIYIYMTDIHLQRGREISYRLLCVLFILFLLLRLPLGRSSSPPSPTFVEHAADTWRCPSSINIMRPTF